MAVDSELAVSTEPEGTAPNAAKRIAVLSVFGLIVAGILALLQTQRSRVQLDEKMIIVTFPIWAIAAALIGSVYPLADHWMYGKIHEFKQDWSNAIRSIAILVGIHQASTGVLIHGESLRFLYARKIPFSNYYELAGTLMFLAVGLWWMSDRSRCGFFLAPLLSALGVAISVAANSIGYSQSKEGLYVSEWCICYSACITFGSIGRILAMPPQQRDAAKTQYTSDKVHVE